MREGRAESSGEWEATPEPAGAASTGGNSMRDARFPTSPSPSSLSRNRWRGTWGPPGGHPEDTWGGPGGSQGVPGDHLGVTWGSPGGTSGPLGGGLGAPGGPQGVPTDHPGETNRQGSKRYQLRPPQIGCPKGVRSFKYGYRLSLFTSNY